MFALRQRGTVIAKGLKIVGSVTAEGLVELNGQVEGEIHCTSLFVSRQAQVVGTIQADRVVVDGSVEGPIRGGQVMLKSQAHVVGDIHHQSLAIEKGALFDGRSVQMQSNVGRLEELEMKPARQIPKTRETLASRIEQAEPTEAE
jgi:cytoskeletal protein CcmA (bactofilin family)